MCNRCIAELQEVLDTKPGLIQELESRATSPNGYDFKYKAGGSTGGPGSKPPVDLELLAVLERLQETPTRAEVLARSPQAREDTLLCVSVISLAREYLEDEEEIRVWGDCTTPGCDARLSAPIGERAIRCRACGWDKDLATVTNHRLKTLDSYPAPPRQTREALVELTGIRVSKKTFENWVYLGKLRYVLDHVGTGGTGGGGRRLYFIRDLLVVYQQVNMVP